MLQVRLRPQSRHAWPISRPLAGVSLALLLVATSASGDPVLAEATVVKKPKFVVEERVHEAGQIARDQVFEHSFKIRNAGDAELKILNALRPPNLEIVKLPTSLQPGEASEIRVRVPLLEDRATALMKQIEVTTNDPDTPAVVLELRIFSTEYVAAKPGVARWISVQKEKPGTISQTIAAVDGSDLEILRTSEPPAGIEAKLAVESTKPNGARVWRLDLTLGENADVGPISGTLLVYVKHPKQSIVPIPLSGFMRPVLAVTPPSLSLGELKLQAKTSQVFDVRVFATEAIHLVKVEHDLPGFPPAVVKTFKDGHSYRITLEFDPATLPKGALRGTLTLRTDSTKVPLVQVPIDGTIL